MQIKLSYLVSCDKKTVPEQCGLFKIYQSSSEDKYTTDVKTNQKIDNENSS